MSVNSEIRIQDSGASIGVVHSESNILDSEMVRRLRWRCRRGLLELDIVLGRFIEQRYPVLDNKQRIVFDELLDLPDTVLWDVITGKKEPAHAHQRVVLELLKEI